MSESIGTRESAVDAVSHEKPIPDNKLTLAIKIKLVSAFITVVGSALMGLTICLWCHGFEPDSSDTGHINWYLIPYKDMPIYFGNHSLTPGKGPSPKVNLTHPGGNQSSPWPDGSGGVGVPGNKTGNNDKDKKTEKPPYEFPLFEGPDIYPKIDNKKYPGLKWVRMNATDDPKKFNPPPDMVQGGIDTDGWPIYVSRALFRGDLIPGKLIPGKYVEYVGRDMFEFCMDKHYEVLCGTRWAWVPACCGKVPNNALEGGWTNYQETLYICRVKHGNTTTTGKVHPSHNVCYIPYDTLELKFSYYECLVAW